MQTCGEKRPALPVTHWITITESDFESKQVKHKHYAASHFGTFLVQLLELAAFAQFFHFPRVQHYFTYCVKQRLPIPIE